MYVMVEERKYYIFDGERHDMSLFGAFPDKGYLLIELLFDRDFIPDSADLVIHSDGMGSAEGERYFVHTLARSVGIDDKCVFKLTLSLEELSKKSNNGLYYYRYDVDFGSETVSYGGEEVTELVPQQEFGDRQLLIYDSTFKTPEFIKGGTMYHIFVDRFASSGKYPAKEGARINPDWENGIPEFARRRGDPIKNNEFFGGDLDGIADKIDYIASLGVTVIYLSPIFDSPSNHKYDTSDYMKVDPMFGGDGALARLLSVCKRRGICLILDGVFNHTGDDSIYFDRYGRYGHGAYSDPDSEYREWYTFRNYPDDYECWWNIKILPRVDSSNEKFREFIFGKRGVIEKYLNMGVSGIRLDVADELSDRFLDEMRLTLKKKDPESLIIGEVWEDASNKIAYSERRKYLSGSQLDSVMNYPLREGVIAFVRDGDYLLLKRVCETIYRHYPKCVSDSLMNFLGTHDTERIITVLAGAPDDGKSPEELSHMKLNEEEKLRGTKLVMCAWVLVGTCYGTPSVFYGDEAGLEGYHDPFCRKPFPWGRENGELESFFKRFGCFRKREDLFKEGYFRVLKATENVFITERFDDDESLITVVARNEPYHFDLSDDYVCVFDSDNTMTGRCDCETVMPFTAKIFKSK